MTTTIRAAASSNSNAPNTPTNDDVQQYLLHAQQAARAAGAILRDHIGCCSQQQNDLTQTKQSNPKDIVTQYDRQAQQAVQSILQSHYPHHAFLGEEDVLPGAEASEQALVSILKHDFVWICDPIDGTANFAAGLPLAGVTVSLVHQGQALLGVVYDPLRDELFVAVRGQGATCNGRPIQVATGVKHLKDALINAGCPADPAAFATSVKGIQALNGATRGVRMMACSALTTAWIASGRLAGHFGYDLSSWDLVAGALLIQEAGGKVTDLDGSEYQVTTRNMLCSNGLIHEETLEILRQADAVSFVRS